MLKKFWQRHRILSILALLLLVFFLVLVSGVAWLRGRVQDSLPILEGNVSCQGLGAQVQIDRDQFGVPTIHGQSRGDVFFAEGFLHGQDRYFQMDLSRRLAAGELSAFFGERTLALDRAQAPLDARLHARAMVAALDEEEKKDLERYVSGVNAGLQALGDVPPEYLLLRQDPLPWKMEDTMLVAFFFFDALSYNEIYETQMGPMDALLPRELCDFLTPDVTTFDQLMEGESASKPLGIPGVDVINLRDGIERGKVDRDIVRTFDTMGIGSNNWAVAGDRSVHGQAMLANDPHLRASIPGSWYRLQLKWKEHVVTGLSAPGAPGILIGENGHVAWGFTNGMADHEDLIVVEVLADNLNRYKTPGGDEPFLVTTKLIEVADGDAIEVKVRSTIWGPVVKEDWQGRPLVLKSVSSDADKHNLGIIKMMNSKNLSEALDAAASWYGPSQNVLVADDAGQIGWVLSGYLVKRKGFDGKVPRSWAKGDVGWAGQASRPRVENPKSGVLLTANNRLLNEVAARELSAVWVPAWRAKRIHQLLSAKEKLSLDDLAAIQLDCRDEQYDRIQALVRSDINLQQSDEVAKAARLVGRWNGNADLSSLGLHILKIFTERLREAVFAPLLQPCALADKEFIYNWPLKDEPFFALLKERPIHLLAPEYASWQAMINQVFAKAVTDIVADSRLDLDSSWDAARKVYYDHPFGGAPFIGDMLNMPARGLPGDANTVRAQGRRFGASMRLVVSPGEAAKGLFQMPGGQSGHYESPHYADQHQLWVNGESRPFAPGKSRHQLTLIPE